MMRSNSSLKWLWLVRLVGLSMAASSFLRGGLATRSEARPRVCCLSAREANYSPLCCRVATPNPAHGGDHGDGGGRGTAHDLETHQRGVGGSQGAWRAARGQS